MYKQPLADFNILETQERFLIFDEDVIEKIREYFRTSEARVMTFDEAFEEFKARCEAERKACVHMVDKVNKEIDDE